MGLGNIIRNLRYRGVKDLNAKKINMWADWQEIKEFGLTLPHDQLLAYAEQLVWRRERCSDCRELGECKICHCEFYELTATPSAECEDSKWPALMDRDTWEAYKQTHQIEISVTWRL